MEGTSRIPQVSDRDIFYYRQRQKNRVFSKIAAYFAEEAERRGITKHDIAEALGRDPSQITRWLSAPSNLTLDTISDLLLALGAEMDHPICRFEDRAKPNAAHPLIEKFLTANYSAPSGTITYASPDNLTSSFATGTSPSSTSVRLKERA
jgi:transcriptional regulator with XRE-family HTH domain